MTMMKRKQNSHQDQSRGLDSFNADRLWEYILLNWFGCNQQTQALMEDPRMSILSADSTMNLSSSPCRAAFDQQETACDACQRFTFASILHVIYRMVANPHFARLMGELVNCSLQENQTSVSAGYNKRMASLMLHELSEPLINREMEVLHLMTKQHSYRDIAEALYISPLTVKTHVHHTYRKLGVNRRRFANQRARELALVQTM